MRVTLVCPVSESRVLPGVGVVAAGEAVDVPDALAGRAPSWRPLVQGEVLPAGTQTRILDEGSPRERTEVLDLGVGLLAQPDVWQPAPGRGKTLPSKESGTTAGEQEG